MADKALIALMDNNNGIELRLPNGAILHCEDTDLKHAYAVALANAAANGVSIVVDDAVTVLRLA